MANSQTAVFKFDSNNQVRSIIIDQSPWFVAQDVCTALRIQNVTQALEKLDSDERSMLNIGHEYRSIFDSRVKEANVISESGLYTRSSVAVMR
jgi:prophage antirepressor-like protein